MNGGAKYAPLLPPALARTPPALARTHPHLPQHLPALTAALAASVAASLCCPVELPNNSFIIFKNHKRIISLAALLGEVGGNAGQLVHKMSVHTPFACLRIFVPQRSGKKNS